MTYCLKLISPLGKHDNVLIEAFPISKIKTHGANGLENPAC